jgi:uncharacterized protein (TIGR03437 family)
MTTNWKAVLATALCAAACSQLSLAQAPSPTILEIDVENPVQYFEDTSDLSKFATDPNATTAAPPRNFAWTMYIGDIVAVNGQPAKGTFTRNLRQVFLNPVPNPGQAIADSVRNAVTADTFEILKNDGTPIGTIVSYGLTVGSPPLGAPLSITQGTFAITGGTGAFLGARGQFGQAVTPQTILQRQASMTEDPANRRRNGGGRVKFVLQVIPMSTPQIVTTAGGPAVTHSSDFSLVTVSKPAAAGEILSLFATALGPTKPGVDPGKPFPASPLVAVNSPVDVTVNGNPAQVLAAVGFPGAVDAFQVNFQVPPGTAKGPATVQVSAAWIAGPAVTIQVQ